MKWLQDMWFFKEIFIPVFDILIVAYLIYKIYLVIAETRAIPALKGILFIFFTTVVANLFYLETLAWVLDRILAVSAIALIVLFQPELRRVLMKIGQGKWLSMYMKEEQNYLQEIAEAVEVMGQRKIGALIVFERGVGLKNYIETGTPLDASISFEVLMTVFSVHSPLHDGAVVIEHKRLAAAGCYLPLSTRRDIRKGLGTRHRAAIGISEETDAAVLVVSEETGTISLAQDGRIKYDIKPQKLESILQKEIESSKPARRGWFRRGKR